MAWRRLGGWCHVMPISRQRRATPVDEPAYGDLAVYGAEAVTHIAFWLGGGRILHAAGGRGVVEEHEPASLPEIRRGSSGSRPERFTSFELKQRPAREPMYGRGRC